MRRRILPRLVAVGVLVLALAGCVRFQADLTVTPANTVDGSIVVAVLASDETPESQEAARSAAQQIETELLGTLRGAAGVTTTAYEDDGYLGSRIDLDDVPFEAFDGASDDALRFIRDGDDVVFRGAIDFTQEAEQPADEGADDSGDDLTVSVTFPGAVREHDGDLHGTTVSWTTTLEHRVEMRARAAATPPGPPVLLIAGIALGVALLVGVVVAVVLLIARGRRVDPAPVAIPPAVEPEAVIPAEDDRPAG